MWNQHDAKLSNNLILRTIQRYKYQEISERKVFLLITIYSFLLLKLTFTELRKLCSYSL
jgi:hypothetical protein